MMNASLVIGEAGSPHGSKIAFVTLVFLLRAVPSHVSPEIVRSVKAASASVSITRIAPSDFHGDLRAQAGSLRRMKRNHTLCSDT